MNRLSRPIDMRDAATVMLVRDGDEGPEVFMMRRTTKAAFVPGVHLFPGGAVDAQDERAQEVVRGLDAPSANRVLGVDHGALSFWLAVVRECFEEAGALIAQHDDGRAPDLTDPVARARFQELRARVHSGEVSLVDVLLAGGLWIPGDRLHYVSHWVTPLGEPRRFDTRFFLAVAPEDQEPLHDDTENIASMWMRPAQVLEMGEARTIVLLPPTVANLRFMAAFGDVASLERAAADIVDPPVVVPMATVVDGKRRLIYEGDPGYDFELALHG